MDAPLLAPNLESRNHLVAPNSLAAPLSPQRNRNTCRGLYAPRSDESIPSGCRAFPILPMRSDKRNGGSMKIKTKRMFSGVSPYHKYDIATGQLETAIRLFMTEGCDMFSALTLAAAAGSGQRRQKL